MVSDNEIITKGVTKDQMIEFVEDFLKVSTAVGNCLLTSINQTEDDQGFFIDHKKAESLKELLQFLRGAIDTFLWCHENRKEVPIKVENNKIKEVK